MPKLNPYSYSRRADVTLPVTIGESDSDERHTITLRRLSPSEMTLVTDLSRELVEEYVGTSKELPSTILSTPDGKVIRIGHQLCWLVAVILKQQTATTDDERYTAAQLFMMAETMEESWATLVQASYKVQDMVGNRLAPIAGQPRGSGSLRLSSTEPTTSHTSSNEPTTTTPTSEDSSGPSPEGLE